MSTNKDVVKDLLQSKFKDDTIQPSRNLFDNIYEGVKKGEKQMKQRYIWYKVAAALILLIGIGSVLTITFKDTYTTTNEVVINNEKKGDSVIIPQKQQKDFIKEKQLDKTSTLVQNDTINLKKKRTQKAVVTKVLSIKKYNASELSKNLTLADDSNVILYKNSNLNFAMDDRKRLVNLNGNSFFEVKKDKKKPFVVKGNYSSIRVTGTSFIASSREKNDHITLFEGSVDVFHTHTGSKLSMVPGQSVVIDDKGIRLLKKSPNHFAWKTGNLSYQNATVEDVLKDMRENFDIEINVQNPNILQCSYTGSFRKSSPQKIFNILELTLKVKIEQKNNIFVIFGNSTCTD